jgi:FtsP/CotA-like multicopper oxidase with cupredoxin domain
MPSRPGNYQALLQQAWFAPNERFREEASAMTLVLTRRRVLAAGIAATLIPLGRRAGAEDGLRTLTARTGHARLRGPGEPASAILGYDGAVPGPTLRLKRGEELKLRLVNRLAEPTTIHWHGLRIANAVDGVPGLTQAPVAPNASFDYRLQPPDAGTFWYRPLGRASGGRGLAGLLIVDEAEPVDVGHDAALVLDDWRLEADGKVVAADGAGVQERHSHLTANGAPRAEIVVRSNERLRLRLLNASGRLMPVRVADHTATVMALDGQPAEPFMLERARIVLAPGNRADLFLELGLAPGATAPILADIGRGETEVARIVYATEPGRGFVRPPVRALPANPLAERMDFARALRLVAALTHDAEPWLAGDPPPPLFAVKRGRTVMLELRNPGEAPQAIHVHGHHFRVLDALDDGWKGYWLDTVLVPPGRSQRIAFVADNPGKWLIEGTSIAPREPWSASWFEVT